MLAAGVALGAVAIPAIASATGSSTVYHACVTTKTGAIKIVSGSAKCATGQHMISWNNTGPRGATGAPGVSTAYYAENSTGVALDDIAPTPVAALSVPRGKYLVTVTATAQLTISAEQPDRVFCNLEDHKQVIAAQVTVGINWIAEGIGNGEISVTAPVNGGGNIVLTCNDDSAEATVFGRVITAVPIRKLKLAPPVGLLASK